MKKIKIITSIGLSIMLSSFSAYAATNSDLQIELTTDILDEYLYNAGYPSNIIDDLDYETKLHFYEDGYSYESCETTYGIFTEEYNVEYEVDRNGNVQMDQENKAELKALLEDETAVNKIIEDKVKATEDDVVANLPQKLFLDGEQSAELLSLSNWSASMVCSHKSYSGRVAKKNLTYNWKWSYSPTWTLTDKVAMAWSGNFTAEPSSISWSYTRRVGFTGASGVYQDIPTSGKGYDDYNPGAGIAKAIDIKGPLAGSYIKYHKGSLSTDITKTTSTNSRESAVGRYYHTRILPGLSLSFSATGPSISVSSSSGSIDQSKDSAVAFWTTSQYK